MISKGFIVLCAAATMLASPALAANLLMNGDFEANLGGTAITGWTVTGDGVSDDMVFPNGGLHDVVFTSLVGDPNPGVLSQDVTTVIGQDYLLTFNLLNQGLGFLDAFNVSFGGFSASINGLDASGFYAPFTFAISGGLITGGTTTLSFNSLSDATFGSPFNLDDVSLEAAVVPEPSQWALMITGFGLAGAMLRRRTRALAA
jgi:hypothetical protein